MSADGKWSCTVPMMLVPPDRTSPNDYLELARRMRADRVLLIGPDQHAPGMPDVEHFRQLADLLRERIRLFAACDISVAFWMWRTIGHSGAFSTGGARPDLQQIVGYRGQQASDCYCPLDANFVGYICEALAAIAQSGVELILLDDDYRMVWHGPEAPNGCFCPLHLDAFCRRTGRKLSRDELVTQVFCGPPSDVRRRWLELNGESLLDFAGQIERAVHAVSPSTRVGLAAASTLWAAEGVGVDDLVRTLAGPTRPLLRVHGAPYWSREPSLAAWITEYTRLQQHWMRQCDVELMAEGDTWPHTRYHCSAAMLHAFSEGLCASGFPGILNYALVYAPPPGHELGYVDRTARATKRYAAIRKFLPADYVDCGLHVAEQTNTFARRTCPLELDEAVEAARDYHPASVKWLARMGVPLAYRGEDGPVLLTGHSACELGDEPLSRLLGRGAVVDAVAACWLTRRGFDVGIGPDWETILPVFEHFADVEHNGAYGDRHVRLYVGHKRACYRFEPGATAVVLGEYVANRRRGLGPSTILYERSDGSRVCVLPFDVEACLRAGEGTQILFDYARQEQLTRCIAWVGRRPLAATVNGQPDVHVICRMSPDRRRMAIVVQNAHLDAVERPTLRLDPAITIGDTIELLTPDGEAPEHTRSFRYEADGEYGYLRLDCTLPAMGLLAVGAAGPFAR
ncbi:MAG TPA: hypothetical protein VMZ31_18675 [Phycisphaerae bacterium]|nr:hypothetical protein [Phycisphaerae bacterium]